MSFLVGLGIILAIVYGNMLYDYVKKKKEEKSVLEDEALLTEEPHEASACCQEAVSVEEHTEKGLILSDIIIGKLKRHQNVFGLPLTLCETDEDGRIVAIDNEDNIYVIETAVRLGYDDLYRQTLEDIQAEKKRIQKHADVRRVYAIVCTNAPSEHLKKGAEKGKDIRIFNYDIVFQNIL